uniref:RES family NAD+ phosphorylase n=1 Tax=Roseovarius sp. BRH_c41 TaxID=1629709 RepID=UPI000A90F176
LVSPFICGSSDEIVQLRADLPFLESLGHELTRPVLPRSAATDYVPSQYLCEFIKKKGFDGVLYTSSVGTGKNLALFDTEAANCIRVSVFSVASVAVTAHEFRTQVRPLERVEN